jgi:hypothetical protein
MKTFKQKSLYTPNWVYNSEFYNNDIKPYIEVDYFSLSTIIIYEPFFFNYTISNDFYINKINIYKLYNWKYIT